VEIIKRAEDVVDNARQHYPPGTQESNKSFESRDLMMEKGKELECTRRAGGSGIREADSDDRGFPLMHVFSSLYFI
jgi:hypothetical protein